MSEPRRRVIIEQLPEPPHSWDPHYHVVLQEERPDARPGTSYWSMRYGIGRDTLASAVQDAQGWLEEEVRHA